MMLHYHSGTNVMHLKCCHVVTGNASLVSCLFFCTATMRGVRVPYVTGLSFCGSCTLGCNLPTFRPN